MNRPLLLDLFCCEGGAAMGYHRAGFDVIGVDNDASHLARYPFPCIQGDAVQIGAALGHRFDAIHASPPCQRYSSATKGNGNPEDHPDLVGPTREMLEAIPGVPYIIENVVGAPLESPSLLCGSMFGLDVQRHRIFETSFPVSPPACDHSVWTPRFPGATNRAPNSRKTVEVGVYRIPLATQREAMGVRRSVSLAKISQMVPPAYAEWLGLQARLHILTQRRAA